MDAATIIAIVVAAAVVVIVGAVAYEVGRRRRLKRRFGPEYERTVDRNGSARAAAAELRERERRRESFDIRPLPVEQRERFREEWHRVQADFVDAPEAAIHQADALIERVMRARGYPVEDFDQRAADLSVDHPAVVEHYRAGHRVARRHREDRQSVTTEDLRQAMLHFRALFDELLETSGAARAEDGR